MTVNRRWSVNTQARVRSLGCATVAILEVVCCTGVRERSELMPLVPPPSPKSLSHVLYTSTQRLQAAKTIEWKWR
jgi:hypothetical protein